MEAKLNVASGVRFLLDAIRRKRNCGRGALVGQKEGEYGKWLDVLNEAEKQQGQILR